MYNKNLLQVLLGKYTREEGVSLREVARRSGISASTVARIDRGETVNVKTSIELARFLGYDASAILENQKGDDALAERVVALIQSDPVMAGEFASLLNQIETGKADLRVLKDVLSFVNKS
jgi:transcriptional regulator with XRE-family HTH domain